ncbi:hypothetical protein F0242_15480 [Vibrio rotiferianus]|nr:hypothetical protein [Vibrio rotiferianus]
MTLLDILTPKKFTSLLPQANPLACGVYTQVTSRGRIQSVVTDSNSRQTMLWKNLFFPNCLTMKLCQ